MHPARPHAPEPDHLRRSVLDVLIRRMTLTTSAAVAIAGKTVTFTLDGASLSATTSSSGVASVKTKAPTTAVTYPTGVTFAGATRRLVLGEATVCLENPRTRLGRQGRRSSPNDGPSRRERATHPAMP